MQRYKMLFYILQLALISFAFPREFDVSITVTDGLNSQILTIGVDPNGTAGFDTGLDVLAPPAGPTGSFDARLTNLNLDYFTDIRNNSIVEKQFHMFYAVETGQGPITLFWNSSGLDTLGTFFIVDDFTGGLFGPIDMTTIDSLEVTDPLIVDKLRILVTPLVPDINVNPTSHNFGNVQLGDSSSQTFVVNNIGTANLQISGSSITGPNAGEFLISNGGGPVTVPPFGTHNIEITFTPSILGIKGATLSISSNDPDEDPFDVALSGEGIPTLVPDISVAPTSHNFGNIELGDSLAQTFVVSNVGAAALQINGSSLTGPTASEFIISSGGGPVTVPASGTHNIEVTFKPTTLGSKSANLSISSNDPDEDPFDVALSGEGIPALVPDISVAPTSHNYGNIELGDSSSQTFIVSNVGAAALQINGSSLTGPNASEFIISSGGGPATVPPSGTHNIEVTFKPITLGSKTATLSISNNDPDEDPFDVQLNGEGVPVLIPDISVAPTSHDYGNVEIGDSSSQTFVVNNVGTGTLEIIGSSLTGPNSGEFIISSGSGFVTVPPAGTHNIDVTFKPTSSGNKSATLSIASNDPDEDPFDVPLTGNGVQPVLISDFESQIPQEFELLQNYPNPFNPVTRIRFALPKPMHIKIEVHNSLGQHIATLINENRLAGNHIVNFEAEGLASGTYFYYIQAGEFRKMKRMVLLR